MHFLCTVLKYMKIVFVLFLKTILIFKCSVTLQALTVSEMNYM